MNADHHFLIGRSHSVCEDYCASHPGFAALADGCSMVLDPDGKPMNAHTDIGARLLVRAAFHHQKETDTGMLYRLSVNTADGYRRQLGLGVETLSATLLALRDGEHGVESAICGDGIVAYRNRETRKWSCWRHQYDGPPRYPRYAMLSDVPCGRLTITSPFDGDVRFDESLSRRQWHAKSTYDLIVAASDGVFSFTKDSKPVPFDAELANRFLDFRGLKGRFVLRNLSGVLRELAEDGIVNQDDVSMIAMHVE